MLANFLSGRKSPVMEVDSPRSRDLLDSVRTQSPELAGKDEELESLLRISCDKYGKMRNGEKEIASQPSCSRSMQREIKSKIVVLFSRQTYLD
jgi:hypothetical protein